MTSLRAEFIPARQPASRRLMIVLHGLGDSSAGYHWLPPTLDLPWMNYLLLNAPDDYYGGYSWFDLDGDPAPGVARSMRLLNQVLDEQPQRGYPTEETVLFGFSQGCLMILETGLRYPGRFAGLIGVSGFLRDPAQLLREAPAQARQQRLLVTHGTLDPLIPCAGMRKQVQALRDGGIAVDWREFPKVHTIDGDRELAAIRNFVEAGYAAG